MTELDLAGYDTEAINRAEQAIRKSLAEGLIVKSRREAAAFHMKVCAQLIADDVLLGVDQWAPRLAEYRYLRDLTAHLYSQAEQTVTAIDGVPSGTGWPVK